MITISLRGFKIFSLLLCMLIVGTSATVYAQKTEVLVVIDPGHGGVDPGNLKGTEGMKDEEHLNLEIAEKLGRYIEENTANIKVVYTRTSDTTISLNDRVKLANGLKADYFISVHCNSYPNKGVYGTETHIDNNNASTSRKLALMIEKEFKTRAKRRSRGVKNKDDRHHNLQVLWQTDMPGVLVECGYISNVEEEKYLNSDSGQEIIASAIYRAFRDHVNKRYPFTIKPKEVAPADSTSTTEPVLAVSENETLYLVQIMASTTPISLEQAQFKDLEMQVQEIIADDGRAYKYRYFVGRETEKKEARRIAKEVKKKGFKDAFIVTFNGD